MASYSRRGSRKAPVRLHIAVRSAIYSAARHFGAAESSLFATFTAGSAPAQGLLRSPRERHRAMLNAPDLIRLAPPSIGRRAAPTFAIISHPDAGKTTLTEKLLSVSSAPPDGGQGGRVATSAHALDWLEIERARGISVTSSVMTFEHNGIVQSARPPGHRIFRGHLSHVERGRRGRHGDRRREGIESRPAKLFEVCVLRDIPDHHFIQQDRPRGHDPLALLARFRRLALDLTLLTWPVGRCVISAAPRQ